MVRLEIDGKPVEVPEGTTLLFAAAKLGIKIPTLCFYEGLEPFTSCMVCLVKDERTGKLIPSCAAPVEEGMRIRNDDEEVRKARRTALELLLSEHVGDCEAPCQRVCSTPLFIPQVLRLVAARDFEGAARHLREGAGPEESSCLGCALQGEKACRRRTPDGAVALGEVFKFALRQAKEPAPPAGGAPPPKPKRFNVSMGRLMDGELEEFLKAASRAPRTEPKGGPETGFTPEEAVAEAVRCLHCDCRKADSCSLRRYSEEYGARPRLYATEGRPVLRPILRRGDVIFEPGKCIKCGICVRITEQKRETLGLAFIGRGFDVQIGVPFHAALEEALKVTVKECVEACPTAALAFKDR
jgi:ferredoxin